MGKKALIEEINKLERRQRSSVMGLGLNFLLAFTLILLPIALPMGLFFFINLMVVSNKLSNLRSRL